MHAPLFILALLALPVAVDDDPIPEILASISADRLKADVETLVAFHTRHSLSDTTSETRGIGAARRWLRSELDRIRASTGERLEVHEQRFTASVRGRDVEMVNIYGFLPGTQNDPLGRTYVVSGHYDSRASNAMDAETYAPGADDDASGTAVVLELARVMSARSFAANLVFLCVDGEELGLFGSKHFAAWAVESGMFIDGFITNDIVGGVVGGKGPVDGVKIRCFSGAEDGLHSPSRELARSIYESTDLYMADATIHLVFRLDRLGRGGDHIPFDERGIPAARLTEANEHYARQHQDVREENGERFGDLPEFVSAPYMARVARSNAASLAELALAPPPPAAPFMRGAVSYDTRLSWPPVPGAAGYDVVWRETTAPLWEHEQTVGPETTVVETRRGEVERVTVTIEGVRADDHFFGVRALSASGHRSRAAVPQRP